MSHTLTEGGQITTHRLRMLRQVIKVAFCISIFIGLGLFIFLMSDVPKIAYTSLWYYFKAYLFEGMFNEIEVSREFLSEATKIHHGNNKTIPIAYLNQLTSPIIQKLFQIAYSKFIQSLWVSSLSFVSLLLFFFYRGLLAKSKQHLSGSKIVSASYLRLKLVVRGKASPISIGKLPLVRGTETQHMLITGGTGSGKTNCLHHILKQIRKNKQKTVIVDTTGVFLERYFREGKDILLNPFNKKGSPWNPWAEGTEAVDYASLAEAFIPTSNLENENYWRVASKTVFISLLQKFSDTKKTSEFTKWLQYENLSNLCKLVEGTKAAAHMDISSEKTASSIRSVASTFLECLENMEDTTTPFSIRDWIGKKEDSWLFLQCTPSQRSLLRPLLSAWISSAIRGVLALPIDLKRRIWFVIDELPTLQRIKDIEMLLTEGRKYGGCTILSLQSPAQIETIYGQGVSKVIIGNTATKVIFRERDPEIAQRISRAFGEREVIEIQEGISYGAHEARDGVSLSMQNKIRPVVSASQILELPINTAFVKLAEEGSVAKVRLQIAKE
jgi:type IV conjugative transfer system coupling protein TraD